MKPLLTLLGICVILLSCEKDPETNALPGNDLPALHLVAYKELLPFDVFSSASRAIFVNAKGEEKEMTLTVKTGVRNQIMQGFHYDTDYLDVQYRDPADSSYFLLISAYTRYRDLETSEEFVSASVQTTAHSDYMPLVILCAEEDCPYLQKQLDSVTLANRIFQKVVTNYPAWQFTSFNQVYYSRTKGTVGFTGNAGEIWALDRFDE